MDASFVVTRERGANMDLLNIWTECDGDEYDFCAIALEEGFSPDEIENFLCS